MTENREQKQRNFLASRHTLIQGLPWEFKRNTAFGDNGPVDAHLPKAVPFNSHYAGMAQALAEIGLLKESDDTYVYPHFLQCPSPLQEYVKKAHSRFITSWRDDVVGLPWTLPYMGVTGRQWTEPVLILPVVSPPGMENLRKQADFFYQSGILDKLNLPQVVCKNAFVCNDPEMANEIARVCIERKKLEFNPNKDDSREQSR